MVLMKEFVEFEQNNPNNIGFPTFKLPPSTKNLL